MPPSTTTRSNSSSPPSMRAFFITGTGRCGTTLLARLLSLSPRIRCEHEKYFRHESMVQRYLDHDEAGFDHDIRQSFEPARATASNNGQVLGVSSGHLYFGIPQIHAYYGNSARFILLVRRPDSFARSALARGFFDPDHPCACEQISPRPDDAIHPRWAQVSPLEKNLWYWRLVNHYVLSAFAALPPAIRRVYRMEDLDLDTATDICRFLGITDIPVKSIATLLKQRINASPDKQSTDNNKNPSVEVNPYSLPITMPPIKAWDHGRRAMLERYTSDLKRRLYEPQAASA